MIRGEGASGASVFAHPCIGVGVGARASVHRCRFALTPHACYHRLHNIGRFGAYPATNRRRLWKPISSSATGRNRACSNSETARPGFRRRAPHAALERMGGAWLGWYLLMGRYDFAVILQVPDVTVISQFLLAIGAVGNAHTETLPRVDRRRISHPHQQADIGLCRPPTVRSAPMGARADGIYKGDHIMTQTATRGRRSRMSLSLLLALGLILALATTNLGRAARAGRCLRRRK